MARRAVQPKPHRTAQAATFVAILTALLLTLLAIAANSRHFIDFGLHLQPTHARLVTLGCLLALLGLLIWVSWTTAHNTAVIRGRDKELSRLALVANTTENAVLITDADGLIEWVNEGFTRVTGYAPADAMGKAPGAFLSGPVQNVQAIQGLRDAVISQKPLTVEMQCAHKRGNRYWLSLHFTPVFDEQERFTNFVGVGTDITPRKGADAQLKRLHRRNELLLNAAGDGIFGLDVQGAISFANPAAGQLTGWKAEELVGKPVSAILHQLRVRDVSEPRDDLFTGAAFIDGTVQVGDTDEFRRRDGTSFPVEYTSTPIREGGTLSGSVVIFRDVTDRHQGEIMRAKQARQFALRADVAFGLTNGDNLRNFLQRAMQAIVKHLDGAFARVWTLNLEDKILELQASAGIYTHIHGQHGRIPVGTLKPGRIAKEGMPQVSHNLTVDPDVVDKEWVLRERMQSFIGFPLFVEGRVVGVMGMYSRNRLPSDAVELLASVADTIAQGTVRKCAEEKIIEQAALLDKSADAILVIDLNNRCTYWNRSAEALYGWAAQEVYGKTADEIVFRDRAYFERARALTLQRGEFSDQSCQIAKGEKPVTVETRWTLVRDDEGRPKSILIVSTDITERKKIEEQFLRTQRMESIGTLAGGIAHDLNNVLAPIMMSVEMLKEKFQDESSRRMLGILETSARRGAGMVKQVLTFARGVDGERVLLQPKHLIKDISKIIHDTFPKSIHLKLNISESLWPVLGDATQLHQVLLNLAVNARDAMPDGGTLSVAAENCVVEDRAEPPAPGLMPGYYTLIKVIDTGTGIPPEVLDRIWEPFFTTKAMGKGTGLGLSTVLGIVRSHNGVVKVQTETNKGTGFFIYLPAQDSTLGAPAEEGPKQLPVGNGELILAIDDEAAILRMTQETLETFGYRVVTARDGAEAVATYTAHRHEIRGVITDLLMPHMDGPSTIRVLRKLNPNVKVIAASGLVEAEKLKDVTGLESIPFLMKPYTAEKLLTTLQQVLADAA
jgi:PAS domain S-box-containing protein